MAKILTGTVVSTAMQNTIVVEVTRHVPHPLYRKLMKRSKKHKVDVTGESVTVGQLVKIVETKPISKGKHFRLLTQEAKETKVVKEAKTEEAKEVSTKQNTKKKAAKEEKSK